MRSLRGAVLLPLLILAGCHGAALQPAPVLSPLPPLATRDAAHYLVQSSASDVRFLVYRDGPLASLGHNHVVRATTVLGDVYVGNRFSLSGFRLRLPVDDFRVDEPDVRATEGSDFAVQPSAAAVSGTTDHMLGAGLLDAKDYPVVEVRSVRISGTASNATLTVRIGLRGVERDLDVPVMIESGDERIVARGTFDVRQSDFGIRPYGIPGGAIRVADAIVVKFRIVAKRA